MEKSFEYAKSKYVISNDRSKLDIPLIHKFLLKEAYWSKDIPYNLVQKSIENSLNFGLYLNENQIGYAKVISDFSTITHLGDVFILESYRGKGLGKFLMHNIMYHERIQGLRSWILLTSDAHFLYEKFGWTPLLEPKKWMEISNPDIYKLHLTD